MSGRDAETVHASCVVVGEAGILVRGPSGAGKSTLARDLLVEASRDGRFARLVCDDRVLLAERHGRLVAAPVPAIAGQIEARGIGLVTMPHEAAAVVRLVVDCVAEDPPRLPVAAERQASLCGVPLPRIAARVTPSLAALILLRLDDLRDTVMTE